jgi:hypothetical protein
MTAKGITQRLDRPSFAHTANIRSVAPASKLTPRFRGAILVPNATSDLEHVR